MKDIKPISSTSATKQIAEQLKDAIISGELGRGDQLPTEYELARMYGVSRPTIREAFKRLAAQNLIKSKRGPAGGTFVSSFGVNDASEMIISSTMLMLSLKSIDVEDVIDVRKMMQIQCCNLAIDHWSAEKEKEIEDALIALSNPDLADNEFCDADVRLNRAIVNASGNAMLEYLMFGVIESLVPVMNMIIVYVRDRSVIIGHYHDLKDALFEKDKAAIENSLKALMNYLSKKVKEAQKAREQQAAQ